MRISGDEFSRITRRALGRFQEPDSRTDIVKRGIREITIMGRLPLPNNVYNLKKLLIAPNPGLFVKIKTRFTNKNASGSKFRQGTGITKQHGIIKIINCCL